MNLAFFKTCCRVTAIGNILAALGALALPARHIEMFYGAVEQNFLLKFYHYNFWIFVFILGVAYWRLGDDPLRLRPIALVGAVGKIAVAASWIYLFSSGLAQPAILLGIVYDGFFGALMAWFYLTTNEPDAKNIS
jgi:hypothetical protein